MAGVSGRDDDRRAESRIGSVWARFRRDRRGAVAIIFGLSLIPVVLFAGAAVDYSKSAQIQAQMQSSADAATLLAIKVAMNELKQNSQVANAQQKAMEAGKAAARAYFANRSLEPGQPAATLTIDMTYANSMFSATSSASGTYQTAFMGLGGMPTIPIGVRSGANSPAPTYIAFSVLLDISQSMGLAATAADMLKLWTTTLAATGEGCTFGCHVTLHPGKPSNSVIADGAGVKLRIHSLRDAVLDILQRAQNSGHGGFYRFAMYTMDTVTSTLTGLSNNYASLNMTAASIDLGPTTKDGLGASYQPSALQGLVSSIPTSGDGSSATSEVQYLVMVTDGVYDKVGGGGTVCKWNHCTGPLDPASCAPYKAKGVKVAVIYTTYLPVYNNPSLPLLGYRHEYEGLVLPFAGAIKPALQACASPDLFFEASDGPAISDAFRKIFENATATAIIR